LPCLVVVFADIARPQPAQVSTPPSNELPVGVARVRAAAVAFVRGSARRRETKGGSMATVKCGKTEVDYDETLCTYTCICMPPGGCLWTVTCPGPGGKDITTSGTGHGLSTPFDETSLVIAGNLAVAAKILGKVWGRRVVVPEERRGVRVRRRTLKGTPEQIAHALGLSLGAKRTAARTSRIGGTKRGTG
jgi:hypothetical protein